MTGLLVRERTAGVNAAGTSSAYTRRVGSMDAIPHRPVMLGEVLGWLEPSPGKVIVDGTVGAGGHSVALAPHLMPGGKLIGIDRDGEALEVARTRLSEFVGTVELCRSNYRSVESLLEGLGIERVDGILLDLGMSSMHVDRPNRGFSFLQEGPLDMRMDQSQDLDASTLIARATQDELERIIADYGEERFSRRIAKGIVAARERMPISTTTSLAEIIRTSVPGFARRGRIHPATRTFQALRIYVNDELGGLEACLESLPRILKPGARAVVISFHSLEDRMVKMSFRGGAAEGYYELLTKKVIRPSEEECLMNPRARSAKLRCVAMRDVRPGA